MWLHLRMKGGTNLLGKTQKKYSKLFVQKLAESNGEDFANEKTGTSMSEAHFHYIGLALFKEGTLSSISDRALFALNWPLMGKLVQCLFCC